MADYKYPADGKINTEENLTSDIDLIFPENIMSSGMNKSFEFKLTGVTSLDSNVSFKIYSALNVDVIDSDNILESIEGIDISSLTGNLVFQRNIIDTLDVVFRIIISGTDPTSTATFLIRAKAE